MSKTEITTQATRSADIVPHPVSDNTTALIQMIERAAMNPDVDIDKMERLLEMQERILSRNAKAAYFQDLASMQAELPVINERGSIKNSSKVVQSTYALWEDVNEAIRPVLSKWGFSMSFRTGQTDKAIIVTGVLSHREGHSEETSMNLPVDTSGSKNAVQAVGSSTSYGKRYTAGALLNLTSRHEDDDGNIHGLGITISQVQEDNIRELAEVVDANMPKFLQHLKIDHLCDLAADRYDFAINSLEKKRKAAE